MHFGSGYTVRARERCFQNALVPGAQWGGCYERKNSFDDRNSDTRNRKPWVTGWMRRGHGSPASPSDRGSGHPRKRVSASRAIIRIHCDCTERPVKQWSHVECRECQLHADVLRNN
jgi:hypothetical protein